MCPQKLFERKKRLILQRQTIISKMIGKWGYLTKPIMQNNLEKENFFGNMSWIHQLNECELGIFWYLNLSSFSVIFTNNIYSNRRQWDVLLCIYLKSFTLFIYFLIYLLLYLFCNYIAISCFFFHYHLFY